MVHTYVEVFGVIADELLSRPPAPVEVYNDIDSSVVNFFRVVRDPEAFDRFQHAMEHTPSELDTGDPVERACKWYRASCVSFVPLPDTWERSLSDETRQRLSRVENLPEVVERLLLVQIEHQDFRSIIKRYDRPDTLFYCAPPHTLTQQDSDDLSTITSHLQGRATIRLLG